MKQKLENDLLPKVIAMYLPQYHEIPENNEWWGEGFTEWTNVKKAVSLYEGHIQPRVPYQKNYYDLSDDRTLQKQMEMAAEYGVDGFCIYHYWFKGKKLLEKPLEQLLYMKEIPLSYCICWANEPWTRTWDGDNGAEQILMKQDYGELDDWHCHFEYLNLFFGQEQYIKMNGKPVIVIYNASEIVKRREMLKAWNDFAISKGYPGIFVLNMKRTAIEGQLPVYGDGVIDFEPFATLCDMDAWTMSKMTNRYLGSRCENREIEYQVFDFEKFCEKMIKRYTLGNANHYLGFFSGWDNSPRRGIDTKVIFENNTPEVFEKYFRIQYQRSLELKNEFIFINAWNEWGEGTFLEPDEIYRYGYLEAIKRTKKMFQ